MTGTLDRAGAALRRRSRAAQAFTAAVVLLAVAGAVVRVTGLGVQEYWGDEQFSVEQTRRTLAHLWQVGLYEVHPPLWALLLHGWIALGGVVLDGTGSTQPEWTRLSSALCGVLTVLVAWTGLRRSTLTGTARGLAVVASATSGVAVVYAQETRSYALLLLAVTGLTAATVGLHEAGPDDPRARRRWLLWGLLASAVHLFGALLSLAAAAVLARDGRWARRPAAVLAAVAVAPQALWLLGGLGRPGFPQAVGWIPRPDAAALWEALTTLLASGGLRSRNDGFAWTAPWGVVAVLALGLVALALRRRGGPGPGVPDRDAGTALLLLRVAGLLLAGTFLVAQVVHVWTLRNLVVVQPALTWGIAIGLAALPRHEAHRRVVAAALLVLSAGALVGCALDLRQPYKNRTGEVAEYLLAQRAARPDTVLVLGDVVPPSAWFLSTARSPDDPAVAKGLAGARLIPRTVADLERVTRSPEPMIVAYVPGVGARDRASGKDVDTLARELVARLGGPPDCRQVPFHGVVVVRCDPLPRPA